MDENNPTSSRSATSTRKRPRNAMMTTSATTTLATTDTKTNKLHSSRKSNNKQTDSQSSSVPTSSSSPPPPLQLPNVEEKVLLTPHTLRLLTLIREGTPDHARLAAIQLSEQLTQSSSSSPMVLWDVLGRLQEYLTSPEWTTRQNARIAMEGIAKHLPPHDQQNFLQQAAVSHRSDRPTTKVISSSSPPESSSVPIPIVEESQEEATISTTTSSTIWLTVDDVKKHWITILRTGRRLLSLSETHYDRKRKNQDVPKDDDDEADEDILEQFDSQASMTTQEFYHRRIQLQREILARRLGLSTVLSHVLGRHEIEETILKTVDDDDDVHVADSLSPMKQRRQQSKSILPVTTRSSTNRKDEKTKKKKTKSIRALLVLQMKQQEQQHHSSVISSASFRQVSHHTAQALLANELVFRMFDASWYVRHGSLLGLLALLRAWRVHEVTHLGIWPQDIMARCLCLLGLDLFADYSETSTSSDTGGGIVAPVREVAGQVFAILFWAAPESIQRSAFQSLIQLSKMARNTDETVHHQNEDGDNNINTGNWEWHHAVLLALKYIFALKGTMTCPPPSKSNVKTPWTNEMSNQTLELAIQSLNDGIYDTRGMAAQLLLVWLNNEKDQPRSLRDDQHDPMKEGLVARIMQQLEAGLSPNILISSTVKDLVALLDALIRFDFRQVVAGLGTIQGVTSPCQRLLSRLQWLMTAPYLSVKISAIALLGKVANELEHFWKEGDDSFGNSLERETIAMSFGDLIWELFRLRFESGSGGRQQDPVASKDESRFFSVCTQSWFALVQTSRTILSDESCHVRSTLERKVLSTYFGFPVTGLALPIADNAVTLSEASHGRNHGFWVDTAEAVRVVFCESESSRSAAKRDEILHLFLRLSIESPFISHVERACLLYASLLAKHQSPLSPVLESSREWFISAIQDCRSLGRMMDPKSDRDVAVRLQKVLAASLESGLESLVNGKRTLEETTNQVISLWGQVRDKMVTESGTQIATLDSMRLSVLIARAILSHGVEGLPPKLTPLVRAIMTSVQNERDPDCQNSTFETVTTLLGTLSDEQGALDDRKEAFMKTRSKILTNLSNIIKARVEPGCRVASLVIGRLAGSVPNPKVTLGGVWDEVESLRDLRERDGKGVLECVVILTAICSDLSNSSTGSFVVQSFCQPLVSLRCTTTDDSIKSYASQCIQHMGAFNRMLFLEVALPKIATMCSSSETDRVRSEACEVLFDVVDGATASLCPFVRSLLPLAMRMMTDTLTRVAKAGARVFSTLVQLAPIVKESVSLCLVPDSGTDETDKVMDHLIHGQPLPSCEIHPMVRESLESSGIHLRTYQLDGITWLRFLQRAGLNGALTDSMGLGKTLQALVGISLAHMDEVASGHTPISLVVCPSSVMGHWEKEVSRFFPNRNIFHHSCLHRNSRKEPIPRGCNLVITSYAVLRAEIDSLQKRKWTYIVLDEGHLLKNPETATAKATRRLNSRFKLILTGTPVQNRVSEVWAVFDFLMPNFLGSSAAFSREFARPISKGQAAGANASDIALSMEKLKLLHQQVLPFILRREKEQVLKELPPKVITTIHCEMSSSQLRLYQNFCMSTKCQTSLRSFHEVLRNPSTENAVTSLGQDVLKTLLYLRLLCTHPSLVDVGGVPSDNGSQVESSGKLAALKELLVESGLPCQDMAAADNDTSLLYVRADECHDEGDDELAGVLYPTEPEPSYSSELSGTRCKCLIFAQFTSSLDVVQEMLRLHFPTVSYLRLDGKVPVSKRGSIVDSFNGSGHVKVLLLTTRIGGLGLNLTGEHMSPLVDYWAALTWVLTLVNVLLFSSQVPILSFFSSMIGILLRTYRRWIVLIESDRNER